MKIRSKIESVFEANQANDFSWRFGRATAWVCDRRITETGMPLGDFEIARDEGETFISKSKIKEPGATLPGKESPEKFHSKKLEKRMKRGLAKLKKLLTTDWGEPED